MYAIYDLKENEQCLGIFDTYRETAKRINTTKSNIGSAISRKRLIYSRYEIVKIEEEHIC